MQFFFRDGSWTRISDWELKNERLLDLKFGETVSCGGGVVFSFIVGTSLILWNSRNGKLASLLEPGFFVAWFGSNGLS
uniref:Uncharacterized protein n=1 Tax=Rhizophagus irregularis (strain DAOM 181602 / DAOM 197198 / MUCL 43194) TaxID=747089 RepID=U9TCL2_RHIID